MGAQCGFSFQHMDHQNTVNQLNGVIEEKHKKMRETEAAAEEREKENSRLLSEREEQRQKLEENTKRLKESEAAAEEREKQLREERERSEESLKAEKEKGQKLQGELVRVLEEKHWILKKKILCSLTLLKNCLFHCRSS